MRNTFLIPLLLMFTSCSSEDGQPETLSLVQIDEVNSHRITEKIADAQEQIISLDKDWPDPEEAAYYAKMKSEMETHLKYLQALESSPFAYHGGKVKLLIQSESLTEVQSKQYDLVVQALDALIERKLMLEEGIKLLVEDSGEQAVVTFAANVPEGSLGPDFSAKVTFDGKTREVTGVTTG